MTVGVVANDPALESALVRALQRLGYEARELALPRRVASAVGVEVAIVDDGIGIDPVDLPHIFDPFFTTKEVGKGTGQGLAIARSIVVDKHGGTIEVESEVGSGTRFRIRLPLGDAGAEAEKPLE